MRIGIIGCAGRMGRTNLQEVLATPGLELAGGVERAGHPALGQDLGVLAGGEPIGLRAEDDLERLLARADAVIEFSTPEATLANAAIAAERGCAHVVGTTGLDPDQEALLRRHALRIPIVWAPNMSQGVNLLLGLVEKVARALDTGFDIEIVEMHHRHKVDAPSGTALALGRAAARGRGTALERAALKAREGHTGPRPAGGIGFAVLRGGDVVGDHTVMFAGAGERLELTHRATDRRIYARGAVRAAAWTRDRPPGLYGMADVLGLGPGGG
ncbi:MAG TPA: 4-hydroxy-tetrahydrodipicolinate reductase [Geminicoccaceae bacterium]|nr:4-hydroxy-tetrahydrodipicolinate reductase [Geminicoccaceae bacterium]